MCNRSVIFGSRIVAWIGIQLHRIWIDSRFVLFAHFIEMELERAIGTSQKEIKNIEILGSTEKISWETTDDFLKIAAPKEKTSPGASL